jgi:integrase
MSTRVKPGITREQRADGSQYYLARTKTFDGQQIRSRFSRQRDAEQWLASMKATRERIHAGLEDPTPKRATRTLGDVNAEVNRWISSRTDISARTRKDYLEIAANLLHSLGDLPAREVTPADVHRWVRTDLYGRALSQARVKKAVTVVGAAFGMLEASDDLETNPVSKAKARWPGLLKPPTDQVRTAEVLEPLTQAQLAAISDAAEEPYDLIIHLLSVTGMRIGELVALEPKHIDLLRGRVLIEQALTRTGRRGDRGLFAGMTLAPTKSGKDRSVALAPDTRQRLGDYLATRSGSDRWLFGSGQVPLDYDRIETRWSKALKVSGIEGHYSLHDIRKAFATALLGQGLDPKSVGAVLGHSPASVQAVTMGIYAQPSSERASAAVEQLAEQREKWSV